LTPRLPVCQTHLVALPQIMVVTDVERNDIEFISRTLGCQPVAHVDTFTEDKLGTAQLCTEVYTS